MREALSYVLTDQGERDETVREYRRKWAMLDAEVRPFRIPATTVPSGPPEGKYEDKSEKRKAQGMTGGGVLDDFDRVAGYRLRVLKQERDELRRLCDVKVTQTLKIYTTFWNDLEVRSALWAVNETARPHVVLGPYESQAQSRGHAPVRRLEAPDRSRADLRRPVRDAAHHGRGGRPAVVARPEATAVRPDQG